MTGLGVLANKLGVSLHSPTARSCATATENSYTFHL